MRALPLSLTSSWRSQQSLLQAVVVVGLLLVFDISGLQSWIKTGVRAVLQPVQTTTIWVWQSTVSPLTALENSIQAQRRAQELARQYAEVANQLEELENLRAENQALRELAATTTVSASRRWLTAPVTAFGRPAIGIGAQQGVESGNLVLINQVLVGRVSEVLPLQAEVELLSSQRSQPVLAKTSSGVEGLVVGDDRRLLMTELPITAQVTVGDRITTVGQLGIPPGILIGQISALESPGTAAAQTAVIDQLVSFFSERIVEVRP